MRHCASLLALVCLAPVRAQADPVAIAAAIPADHAVAFDEQHPGELWVDAATYKVRVEGGGVTYVPFFGSRAERSWPIRLALRAARVGGVPVRLDAAQVTRHGRRVEIERGGLVEWLDVAPHELEQSFVFAELPARGELCVEVAVDTELAAASDGDAVVFRHAELGEVRYDRAVAVDARGRRCALELRLGDGAVEILVPAAFVVEAALPLVVDPVVAQVGMPDGYEIRSADLSFDETYYEYVLVWERVFSATDHDVIAARLDLALAQVGGLSLVDVSLDSWQHPRIANCNWWDAHLVVAQVVPQAAFGSWISGRVVHAGAAGSIDPVFDIERDGVVGLVGANYRPDVGGDPDPSRPTWFTVVWEHEFSTTDHDVYLKQVDGTGQLRNPIPTPVDTSAADERAPAISRSNGAGDFQGQRWFVAWERGRAIRGAVVDPAGSLVPAGGAPTFDVTTSGLAFHSAPEVSSATDARSGHRAAMFVWRSSVPLGASGVGATLVGDDGVSSPTIGIGPLFGLGAQDRRAPAVDTDGCRFAVAYQESSALTGNEEVYVATIGFDGTALVPIDGPAAVGVAGPDQLAPQVLALYTAAGTGQSLYPLHRYAIAHLAAPLALGSWVARISLYDGLAPGGGYATRPTGCGDPLVFVNPYSGEPAIGNLLTFNMPVSGPTTGFVVGPPLAIPIPFCPGCELGVDGFGVSNPFTFRIPCHEALVGQVLSVQGWSLGSGPCLGTLSLSDTLDLTVQ